MTLFNDLCEAFVVLRAIFCVAASGAVILVPLVVFLRELCAAQAFDGRRPR